MRRFALALLALCLLAGPAHAVLGYYTPFTKTPRDSTRLHVLWVEDDYATANNTAANVHAANVDRLYQNLDGVRARLEKMGLEVHVYSYSQMQANPSLWRWAGGKRLTDGIAAAGADSGGYGVAVLPYWWLDAQNAGSAHRASIGPKSIKRFTLADSTNVHIIHFGDQGHSWNDNVSVADTALGHYVINATFYTVGDPKGIEPRLAASLTDTLFCANQNSARTILTGNVEAADTKAVRLFNRPSKTDTLFAIAATRDTFVGAWRVYSTNTGKYVDFVLGGDAGTALSNDGPVYGSKGSTDLLWALMSRHVRIPPVKVAMEIADFFEWGYDPRYIGTRTDPAVNGSGQAKSFFGNWNHPRPTYMDTLVRVVFPAYNINKFVIGTTGDSLAKWYAGSAAWKRSIDSWGKDSRRVRWFYHDHDKATDTASAAGPAFGVGQNYADTVSGAVYYAQRTPRNLRYSLARTDSIFRSLGVTHEKFLLPGADRFVPMGAYDYSNASLCPAESLFASLDALGFRYVANHSNGEINIAGVSASRSVQTSTSHTQNSTTGYRWQLYPDETYRTATGGRIRFGQYAALFTDSANTGPTLLSTMAGSAQSNSPMLMGLYAFAVRNSEKAVLYGQTAAPGFDRPWGDDRCRVFGWHSNSIENYATGFQPEMYNLLATLKRIKTCEKLAGHQLVQWVFPSEAFEAP